jgi:hypothetical protein
LLFFALLTGFSIGLFVLPVALVACWFVGTRGRHWPEVLGGVTGIGLTSLGIALANRGSNPCSSSGFSVSSESGGPFECGGLDPAPWLVAGCGLVAAGVLAYGLALAVRRHHGPGAPG